MSGKNHPFNQKITCSYRLDNLQLTRAHFYVCIHDEWALPLLTEIRPCRKTTGDIVGWMGRLNLPVAITQLLKLKRFATILSESQRDELKEWLTNRCIIHIYPDGMRITATGKTATMMIEFALKGRIPKRDIKKLSTDVFVTTEKVESESITIMRKGPIPLENPKRLIALLKFAYSHRTMLLIYSHVKPKPANIKLKESFELRDYQKDAVIFFEKNGRALVVLPPGAGKTYVGLGAIERMKAKTVVLVPTRVLKKQWQTLIDRYFIYKKEPREQNNDIIVMTYNQALRHNQRYFADRMIIADEAHYLGGRVFRLFARHGTPVLALTATPYRGDAESQQILSTFPYYYSGLTWREWEKIYKSIAVPTVYVGPRNISSLRGIISRHKNVLILCRKIKTAEQLAKKLNIAYIHANASNRDTILSQFRDGKIRALATTTLLSQGFDYPELESVVVWDTGGIITTLQFIGRVMRTENGNNKKAYIFTGKGGLNKNKLDEILSILGVSGIELK